MNTIITCSQLQKELKSFKDAGQSVGLVPTMGALHKGHLSLIQRSVVENDKTVVSIFVNPTQFNDQNDLKNYPRNLDSDILFIQPIGVDIVFAPTVEEMYPEPDNRKFDFGILDKVMERNTNQDILME